jgi:hypothetical protein
MPSRKRHLQPYPDDPGDYDAAKERVFAMLHGDDYWHRRIMCVLAAAGIATRRIERMEEHPIWQTWLTRESFDLSPDKKTAIRQLRKVLRDGGVKVVSDEFNIVDRRGDKLRCVFMLDLGAPGVA